jgi:metallo-beta-lactamase family protein
LFQGPKRLKALNYEPFPFDPRSIDFVLLTHAHIDHSGLLPRLVKQGFRGPIHATGATVDLCSCMLPDAGHIQEMEVEFLNRRNLRRGREQVTPIYTVADAERTLGAFRTVEYGHWIAPGKGVRARYWNAGHMLGSSSIELELDQRGKTIRVLISGDIGPSGGGLEPVPEGPVGGVDYVIVESTYGDESRHDSTPEQRREALAALVRGAAAKGGSLLIPVFAVERAQEVIVDLVRLMDENRVPVTAIHLDSPLATKATAVFMSHAGALGDADAVRAALASPQLRFVHDAAASRALTQQEGFQIVLAGSGMCDAGRIRQHLKARLWDDRTTVVLVGFQAAGTLGRLLREGAARVRIQGETIVVGARIAEIVGYSAHADGPALGRWVEARAPVRGSVFLVHGEPEAIEGLALRVVGRGVVADAAVMRPRLDEVFTLAPGTAAVPAATTAQRRAHPEQVGAPDWHNERAALMLQIEEAIELADGDATRAALLERLHRAIT